MTTTQRSTVVGVFRERDEARDAIEALKDAGFDAQDIGILSPDKEETRAVAEETGAHAGSGAATGAVAGGILGGLGGWLVGIGALAVRPSGLESARSPAPWPVWVCPPRRPSTTRAKSRVGARS